MRPVDPPTPSYSPGETAPASGVYLVRHYQHRLPHEVTILKDEQFPRCRRCGPQVRFELLRDAVSLDDDLDLTEQQAKRKGNAS
jgi:hypothetical protein